MKQFNVGKPKKARVWTDQLPDVGYQARANIERRVEAKASRIGSGRCAAVEFFAITGPRDLYGLLGARFAPNQSERLVIRVAVSDDYGEPYTGSLAGSMDQVYVGIPHQFADSVLEAAASSAEIKQLGSGMLLFDHGAHGQIGSARIIFQRLAKAVVRILASETGSISAEEIDTFLRLGDE